MVFIILSLKRNFCKEKNLKLTPFCVRFRFSLVTPTGFCPLLRGKQTIVCEGFAVPRKWIEPIWVRQSFRITKKKAPTNVDAFFW